MEFYDVEPARFVPVDLEAGATLHIEVTHLGDGPSLDTERAVAAMPFRMEDVFAPIEAMAREIGGLLQRVSPSKAAVEFGVEVAVESGRLTALLVKGSGKANLKVTLNWDGPGKAVAPPNGVDE